MEAVILWQSVQLQTKVSTRPGASVGWKPGVSRDWKGRGRAYEGELDGAAEAGCAGFGCGGPAVAGEAGEGEV